jgi:hypothetical protein
VTQASLPRWRSPLSLAPDRCPRHQRGSSYGVKHLVLSRAFFCRLLPFSQVKSPKANSSLAGSETPGVDLSVSDRAPNP